MAFCPAQPTGIALFADFGQDNCQGVQYARRSELTVLLHGSLYFQLLAQPAGDYMLAAQIIIATEQAFPLPPPPWCHAPILLRHVSAGPVGQAMNVRPASLP